MAGSDNNGLGSCEADHVSIGPQEDRGVPAGKGRDGEDWLKWSAAQWHSGTLARL
jgi:hypothetical protein